MSTQAHPLTDLGFKPEATAHPLSDLGFQPEQESGFKRFGKGVAEGMGFDAGKLQRAETDPEGHMHPAMGALEAVRQFLQGTGKWMDKTIQDPAHIADPITSMASGLETGFKNLRANPSLETAGGAVGSLANVAAGVDQGGALRDAAKAPLEVGSKAAELGKNATREVMGTGATSERMVADRIAHAQAIKEHVSNIEDAVHEKAKAGAVAVDSAVDTAHPEGFFDKPGIRMGVRSALGEIAKIPEKWPTSVNKLLAEEKTTRTTGPSVGGRTMDLSNPNDFAAYQRYKANGIFSPEEIQRIEGAEKTTSLSMEQVRQLRSEVGRDLGRYENKGAVGAALKNVYGYLTSEMRKAAATVGKESEFLENNADYKQWVDDFHRSPLKKILNGQTSGAILRGLQDERTQGLLEKYEDFGADPEALKQEAKRAAVSGLINRFSRPSKWDMIVAAISPHAAAFRLGIPYAMRRLNTLDTIAGKGLPTEEGLQNIKPAQVYTSKKAAALAARNK